MQSPSLRRIWIAADIIGSMLRTEEVIAWVALSRAPALDAATLKGVGNVG